MGNRKAPKARMQIVETVPGLSDMEIGEFLYDSTNGKIVLRTIDGYKYFTQDS